MAQERSNDATADGSKSAFLAAYSEVCKSYHAIDDFRMKLLGALPLASLVGIFLLDVRIWSHPMR